MKTFEDLEAWKEAKALAAAVYRIAREKPLSSDFSLRDQIQRSAVSIMSNIAEGFERLHKLEKKQFYNIARASCGELRSQLHLLKDIGFISPQTHSELTELSNLTGKLTSGLLRSLDRS